VPAREWQVLLFMSLLLIVCGGLYRLEAQDTTSVIPTNDVTMGEDLAGTLSFQAEDAAGDDELAVTNSVTQTNAVANPGPDARARRLSRQRRSRPAGNAQTNGYSQTDSARTNGTPTSLEYSAFRLVADRNIFDPNRSPRSTGAPVRPKTIDSFTLVGTMSYEKGVFAFFDGTSSDYKKAARPEDVIAGYKVIAISPESVKLMLKTNVMELRVGSQMHRREDGTWERSSGSASYAEASSTPASTAAPASGAESDVIKKMMQRREKE